MKRKLEYLPGVIATVGLSLLAATAEAKTTLKTICRVKGQEENMLHAHPAIMKSQGAPARGTTVSVRLLVRTWS